MHLTDEQLNEYLDNESNERADLETHLATCAECVARLSALQALFAELDSLPELELTHPITRFAPTSNLIQQPPRWLTLTATLQAVVAVIALAIASPFVISVLPAIPMPSIADSILQIQAQWFSVLDLLSSLHFPSLPHLTLPELPSIMLALTLAGASLLWVIGNGLLLKRQA